MADAVSTINLTPSWDKSPQLLWVGIIFAVCATLVFFKLNDLPAAFPSAWHVDITAPIDIAAEWVVDTFSFALKPTSAAIISAVAWVNECLLAVPFAVLILALTLLTYRVGPRVALLTAVSFSMIVVFGLWQSSITTLTLMLLSVVFCCLLGVPIGIASAKNDRFNAALRPVLDAMQTMPAFVYLVPVLMLFGLGDASAVVATLIYAIPPVIRMTDLGIRQIPIQTLEAARSYGATPRQMLVKVELPMARPAIIMGINQTVMMALSMVILVALIGAGGLGKDIWMAMRRLQIGEALAGGIAVVLLAVVLDRFIDALCRITDQHENGRCSPGVKRRFLNASDVGALTHMGNAWSSLLGSSIGSRVAARLVPYVILLALVWFLSVAVFDLQTFPAAWELSLSGFVDPAVKWVTLNFSDATTSIRNNIYIYGLGPTNDLLHATPWPVMIGLFAFCAWQIAEINVALIAVFAFVFIGLTGMWDATITTLSQVIVALAVSVLIGVPFGILNAKFDRLSALTRPILDTMQTLPAFVYFPLVVMLFSVGSVSGVLVTIIYAMVPVVRLTELGLREVPTAAKEAAISCGSTPQQMLWKVELPLALPCIMMGINQTLMMAFAMVTYAALIGADGLGYVVLKAISEFDFGSGLVAGVCIVLLALLFDRTSQAWADRYKKCYQGRNA